jgi:DNA-binding transcriptional LysR family regulator
MIEPSDISSRQLKIFRAVMDEKNIGSASRKLFLSQPAVSQAIANLEKLLDITLFHRSRKGVTPTKSAQILLDGLLKSESCMIESLTAISEVQQLKRGSISIAASDTLSLYLLADPMSKFQKQFSSIELSLRNRPSDIIVEMVKSREVDIGLISLTGKKEDIDVFHIDDSPMMLIMPKALKLKIKSNTDLNDLASLDLILLEKPSRIRRGIESAFQAQSITTRVVMEVSSFEVAKLFVRKGFGSSILPQIALSKQDQKNLRVIELSNLFKPVSYGLITQPGVKDMAITKFIDMFV